MKTNTEDSWVLTAPTGAFALLVTQQAGYLSFRLAAYRETAPVPGTTRSGVGMREVASAARWSQREAEQRGGSLCPGQSTTTEFGSKITISLPFQKVPCLFSF